MDGFLYCHFGGIEPASHLILYESEQMLVRRWQCATSQKVASSIPDEVIAFFLN